MKLLKSKQGFTLIELLVVIGILAVLAAIAIPSVAGLIDRANVSADSTNANEMTNAVERFVSEYELYCQDLASNQVKLDNLDAAQGRVYNVTGADDRADIEALEGAGLNGKQINIDTKYPTNVATMQAVVENYMKTSSTTFTPKQSDQHYWYSPDCGVVVYAEPDADVVADLNSQIQSGKDAKGKDLSGSTQWIDLTANVFLSGGDNNDNTTGNLIPEGAIYQSGNPSCEMCAYDFKTNSCYCGMHTASEGIPQCPDCQFDFSRCYCGSMTKDQCTPLVTYQGGDAFPEVINDGDVFKYDGYTYMYNKIYHYYDYASIDSSLNGWSVRYDGNVSQPSKILNEVNGKPVVNADYLFYNNTSITKMPEIPSNITSLKCAFNSCTNLTDISNIVNCTNVMSLESTFAMCSKLTNVPDLTNLNNLTDMNGTFEQCTSLTKAPAIPNSVQSIKYVFSGCKNLNDVSRISIPSNLTNAAHAFEDCTSLTDASNLVFSGDIDMQLTFCQTGLTDEGMPQLKEGIRYLATTFGYCNNLRNLKNYQLPSTVVSLQDTFTKCKNLEYAPAIPTSVTYMLQTYKDCTALKESPVIPANCKEVMNVFWGCTSLKTVIIDSTPTRYSGFLKNSSVTSVIKSNGSTHPLASTLLNTK